MGVTAGQLVGVWNLVDFILVENDTVWPWGPRPTGLLLYHPEGMMSVTIVDHPLSPNRHLFYAGPYRVEGEEVIHEVEVASSAARIGQPQRRRVQLDEPRLILAAAKSVDRAFQLVWQRRPTQAPVV